MSTTLLDDLRAAAAVKAQQSAKAWRQLVVDASSGEMNDAGELLQALEAAGRTPEDLHAAIELLRHRQAMATTAADAETAEADQDKAVKAIDAESARFAKLEAEHEKKLIPMMQDRDAAATRLQAASAARRELLTSIPEEIRAAALATNDEACRVASSKRQDIARAVSERDTWIRRVQGFGDQAATADLKHLAEKKSQLAELQKNMVAADSEICTLQSERKTIELDFLKPEGAF